MTNPLARIVAVAVDGVDDRGFGAAIGGRLLVEGCRQIVERLGVGLADRDEDADRLAETDRCMRDGDRGDGVDIVTSGVLGGSEFGQGVGATQQASPAVVAMGGTGDLDEQEGIAESDAPDVAGVVGFDALGSRVVRQVKPVWSVVGVEAVGPVGMDEPGPRVGQSRGPGGLVG